MTDNTLKIRIKFQQPQPQAIETFYPEPEIDYEQAWDWKKITISAVSLLTILIVFSSLMFPSESQKVSITETQADAPLTMPENTIIASEPIEKAPEMPEIRSSKITALVKPVAVPRRKPAIKAIIDHPGMTEKEIPKTAIQTKPQKITDHPEVVKVQMSNGIKAREPIDMIDAIQLHAGESKTIYFYAQLKNLRGKKIRIDWYHDNKLDSQLNLQVQNNNWRTHASKQLDHRRLGDWHVDLIDESGNRLVTRSFTVTQN